VTALILIHLQNSVLRPAGMNKIYSPFLVADSFVSYVNMCFNRVFSHSQMSKLQIHVTEYLFGVNKLLLVHLQKEIFETF
jgi:hypothetical protein